VHAGAELVDPFSMAVLSAFSEAFNNLALHGYRDMPRGTIDIEVRSEGSTAEGALYIRLADTGRVFDPSQYVEPPDELPERGMGLFIMRGFLDEMRYEAGPPNVLTLVKRW
jgi:serine/threonine-protein kinase RsbW